MPDEYPRVVYRPGTMERVWNEFDCDYRLVQDEAEHKAALASGWYDDPSGGHVAPSASPEPPAPAASAPPETALASEPGQPLPPEPKPAPRKRGPYRKRRRGRKAANARQVGKATAVRRNVGNREGPRRAETLGEEAHADKGGEGIPTTAEGQP